MLRMILLMIATLSWGGAATIAIAEGMTFASHDSMAEWICKEGKNHVESVGLKVKFSVGRYDAKTNTGSCSIRAENYKGQDLYLKYELTTDGFVVTHDL